MCAVVVLAVAVIAALLAGATLWPMGGVATANVPVLSKKAFEGTALNYNGSALIAFSLNTSLPDGRPCKACSDLHKEINQDKFKKQLKAWETAGTLKIGKIYCNDERRGGKEVCERFGLASEADGEAPGYPHLLWFKGGKQQGPYEGERSLAGLVGWVSKKSAAGSL